MKNCVRTRRKLTFAGLLSAALLAAAAALPFGPAAAQKMKAEDVLAKHLESIGTAEDRAATTSRLAQGTATLTLRSPGSGQNSGLAMIFSTGDKSVIAMNFRNPEYPADKFGFDGNKLTVSYIRPGIRSQLGDFIHQRDVVFKQGLMGGTLSAAWPLLNFDSKNAKLEYGGTAKVNDRQAHEIGYVPRKGSDLKIKLYFDAENFQHLRTVYEQSVTNQVGGLATRTGGGTTSGSGSVDADKALQRDLRYRLVEDFSDYKKEGKLTLPHTYKITLDMDRLRGGGYRAEWEMKFEKFGFNQPLESAWFDVTAAQ